MLFTSTLFFCQVASKHRSTAVWRMCARDLQVMIDTLAMWHTSNCFRLAYCRRKLKTAPALKLLTCWSSANSQRLASPQSQEKDLMVGLANLHAPRSSETIQRDLHRKLETHCDYWSCCDCCDFAVFESCVDFPDYSNCRLALGYHYLKERRGSDSKKTEAAFTNLRIRPVFLMVILLVLIVLVQSNSCFIRFFTKCEFIIWSWTLHCPNKVREAAASAKQSSYAC